MRLLVLFSCLPLTLPLKNDLFSFFVVFFSVPIIVLFLVKKQSIEIIGMHLFYLLLWIFSLKTILSKTNCSLVLPKNSENYDDKKPNIDYREVDDTLSCVCFYMYNLQVAICLVMFLNGYCDL